MIAVAVAEEAAGAPNPKDGAAAGAVSSFFASVAVVAAAAPNPKDGSGAAAPSFLAPEGAAVPAGEPKEKPPAAGAGAGAHRGYLLLLLLHRTKL